MKVGVARTLLSAKQRLFGCDEWLNHHKLAHAALIQKLDAAGDLGKQSVILAATDIQSGLHPRPTLPDDDRPTRNNLSAKRLKAQPLRIRIAPVSRSALTFFMCHEIFLDPKVSTVIQNAAVVHEVNVC
jgi:hypothetical protein